MNIQTVEQFLFWCMIINFGLMLFSFAVVTVLRPMVLNFHSRMFHVSEDYVGMAIYAFLGLYKLLLIIFIIIPWVALKIIAK